MLKEFRDFINRGNVVDLAVAVVMAASFGLIVTSLVNDITMPFIGVLLGGIDFSALAVKVGSAVIAYGKFIQAVVNFVIIALVIFLVVRAINAMTGKKKDEKPAAPPEPPEDVRLLREIRDLLVAQNSRVES